MAPPMLLGLMWRFAAGLSAGFSVAGTILILVLSVSLSLDVHNYLRRRGFYLRTLLRFRHKTRRRRLLKILAQLLPPRPRPRPRRPQ